MSRLTRDGTVEPSRETKCSGANADREIFIFLVQLTTSRIGNLTRVIHTLAAVLYMCDHTYVTKGQTAQYSSRSLRWEHRRCRRKDLLDDTALFGDDTRAWCQVGGIRCDLQSRGLA